MNSDTAAADDTAVPAAGNYSRSREGFKIMVAKDEDFIGTNSVQARSAEGAAAVAAAICGASVGEAYESQGIRLPSVGAQVADPVAPDALQASDIGVREDDLVMALGNGKVLVSGQVQSTDSVSSGPDFLGWFDPTRTRRTNAGH